MFYTNTGIVRGRSLIGAHEILEGDFAIHFCTLVVYVLPIQGVQDFLEPLEIRSLS
jgi:hypothetical protein